MQPTVTILVPHFQTPRLTMLCLRLLRLSTSRRDYETIVIDNGSTDGSGDLLRNLQWIRLLRREPPPNERPALSHGLALNLGLEHARAPLVLTMHTDTMVLRTDWLDVLIATIERGGPGCASVGSWKMESHGWFRRLGKWFEMRWRNLRGRGKTTDIYIRSHCALYRRDAVLSTARRFVPSEGKSAGQELHDELQQRGLTCHFLPPQQLARYVRHLNHATMALNDHFGESDPYMPRTRKRAMRRIRSFFQSIRADHILADSSLDV
jgi:glycosyltransferase involved in cell wall biosynthesis